MAHLANWPFSWGVVLGPLGASPGILGTSHLQLSWQGGCPARLATATPFQSLVFGGTSAHCGAALWGVAGRGPGPDLSGETRAPAGASSPGCPSPPTAAVSPPLAKSAHSSPWGLGPVPDPCLLVSTPKGLLLNPSLSPPFFTGVQTPCPEGSFESPEGWAGAHLGNTGALASCCLVPRGN